MMTKIEMETMEIICDCLPRIAKSLETLAQFETEKHENYKKICDDIEKENERLKARYELQMKTKRGNLS